MLTAKDYIYFTFQKYKSKMYAYMLHLKMTQDYKEPNSKYIDVKSKRCLTITI